MHRRSLLARLAGLALACLTWRSASARAAAHEPPPPGDTPPRDWVAFELADLLEQRKQSGSAYLSFIKSDSLSTGLYHLPAGAEDGQTPHRQDEVYHILKGRATLVVAGETQPVKPGTTIYVRRTVEHRFRDIEDDLTVLVFFASPPAA